MLTSKRMQSRSVIFTNRWRNFLSVIFLIAAAVKPVVAQPPTPPEGFRWVVNHLYSDEFNGNSLDDTKWNDSFDGWKGRQPASFEKSSVSVSGGNMQIKNQPGSPQAGYSISGGAVQSKNITAHFGYYECKFKASRINMSTTFWMSSKAGPETRTADGNDTYSQELDICESIGGAGNFSSDFRKKMKFNTHYRLRKDPWPEPETFYSAGNNQVEIRDGDLVGGDASLGDTESWEDYHTYGCHWRNAQEAAFYVDGRFIGVVNFRTDVVSDPFKDPMRINMVTETYNWAKPYPTTAELNNDAINTSYYDWIRSYELVPIDQAVSGNNPTENIFDQSVAFNSFNSDQPAKTSYSFDLSYKANSDNDLYIIIRNPAGGVVATKKYAAYAGYGIDDYTITLPTALSNGQYTVTTEIREVNGSTVVDSESKVMVVSGGDDSTPTGPCDDISFEEKNGIVAFEAEDFFAQELTSKREWFVIPDAGATPTPDPDPVHTAGASGGKYVEILPDTRVTHGDPLVVGESFSNTPGVVAVLKYKVHFNTTGRYYVWVRAYSTGSEDNGVHVGIDGTWPASGARMQWCTGKNAWTWESKQRTDANHCGEAQKIYIDVDTPGDHVIQFSMREDGFEMDKMVLAKVYAKPTGDGPAVAVIENCDSNPNPTDCAVDLCPNNPNKTVPGLCGCDVPETAECQASAATRPVFNKSTDILIPQFDSKPDPDDIHSQAALGCMLSHKDLEGVNYFAVAGAVGKQNGNFIDSDELFDLAFGAGNWTDADANWNGSVLQIANKVIPILQGGGKVWVQEAGQSDITADWVKEVQKTVDNSIVSNNVIVVQHSQWNQDQTTTADLDYVRDNTNYFYIDDGNAPITGSWGDHGPWQSPEYRSTNTQWLIDAENSPNPRAKALWLEASRVIDREYPNGIPYDWSAMKGGGIDYSDCSENWWIFSIGDKADNVTKFWNRYVTNTTNIITPNPVGCTPNNSNNAPQVSFTTPVNNATFGAPANVEVTVDASDNDGTIASVQLFLDDVLVRAENVAPYNWGQASQNDVALQGLAYGTYELKAIATDNDGATTTATITITVTSEDITEVCVNPTHDAYLQGTTKFNTTDLRVESGNRVSYLQFDLSQASGTVLESKLTMNVSTDAGSGNIDVNLGTSNNWTEANLSSANAPAKGALLGNLNTTYALSNAYDWNLSGVDAGGTVSLVLTHTSGNDVSFSSREGTNQPQLCLILENASDPVDCNGDPNGTASIDDCGVCSGGNTGVTPNTTCLDCNGDVNGTASIDACGICSGGNTGVVASSPSTWYQDSDNDGFGDPAVSVEDCNQPAGYVAVAGDQCVNDANKTTPGDCGCGVVEGTCNQDPETVTLINPATSFNEGTTTFTFDVSYSANESREVFIEIRNPANDWLGGTFNTVTTGSGVTTVSLTLNAVQVPASTGYKVHTHIRPIGTNWQSQFDNDNALFDIVSIQVNDCAGVPGGTASIDACGVCSGGNTGVTPSSPATWYEDVDGDGAGDASSSVEDCNQPTGYVAVAGDQCPNDGNKTTPGDCGCGVEEGTCSSGECNAPAYDNATAYDQAGTQVIFQGKLYQNKWYTQGNEPGDVNGPWELIGFCGAAPLDCSGLSAWDASTAYSTTGTVIVHNGVQYSNRWYASGIEPGTHEVWEYKGPCTESSLSNLKSTVAGLGEGLSTELVIYPNPIEQGSSFNVVSDGSRISNIEVLSGLGESVLVMTDINSTKAEVKLTNRSAGIYFVKVILSDGTYQNLQVLVQ